MKDAVLELILRPWSSYDEAKKRSEEIDALLGFEIKECEARLSHRQDRTDWSHLSEQAFQTPYPELVEIVRHFQETKSLSWADLGAGYGRLGLMLSWLRPQDQFIGFEFVPERVQEGRRVLEKWQGPAKALLQQDLLDPSFSLPSADVYFIFDFGQPAQINSVLDVLKKQALLQPITIIGRGRATRHLIAMEHPWLSQVEAPLHTDHWSLYRSSAESAGAWQ